MHKKGFIFIIALLFWPCLTQAELVQDERAILDRVDRIERDLTLLQRKIYKQDVQDASSVTQAPMGSVQHLYAKVADVEQIAADLTNQFEELKHQQKLLTERMDRMNADMDIRLTDLEKGQQRLSKEEKKSSQDESVKEKTITENPTTVYESAYQLLKQTDYIGAEKALRAFLEKYPEDSLAGNAQYWLGETYYVRGQYEAAAVTFAEGFKKYKTSTKGPDNLLKLGMSMSRLGKEKEACTAFKSLSKEFPNASQTLKSRAQNEAEKLSCS